MVNLERTCVLLFYCFLCLKANLNLEKTNQLGESSTNFIFAVVNLDPIILEKRWIDGESWPNDFVEKVNRGEDLRWVDPRCPLTHALNGLEKFYNWVKVSIMIRIYLVQNKTKQSNKKNEKLILNVYFYTYFCIIIFVCVVLPHMQATFQLGTRSYFCS